MFTGIIQEVGKIINIIKKDDQLNFQIEADKILEHRKQGQSIAVNGVCTTITKFTKSGFSFDAIRETLKISTLGKLQKGEMVNLENPLKFNETLDGHLIQGHVDCMGEIKDIDQKSITIKFPHKILKYLIVKGSIAVDGISLTMAKLKKDNFRVAITPHTFKNTNLRTLKKNSNVNLEVDIFGKYLEKFTHSHGTKQG